MSDKIQFVVCLSGQLLSRHDKLKEGLIKYDRRLACRGCLTIVSQDRRQANSLSYLIRAS